MPFLLMLSLKKEKKTGFNGAKVGSNCFA